MMDFADVLDLISMTWVDMDDGLLLDADGNQTPIESKLTVSCAVGSIGQSEFYQAAVAGLTPEKKFAIRPCEYSGQRELEHGGVRYAILRTYQMSHERLELTARRKIGNEKSVD